VVERAVPRRPRPERRGEARLPAAIAVLGAIALYTLLPDGLVAGGRYVVPALGLALLVPLFAVNPRRLTRETQASRAASLGLVGLIGIANTYALAKLLTALLAAQVDNGRQLLVAALQVWLTNVIVYGLAYWELDRDGPVARTQRPRRQLGEADFMFPQDQHDDAAGEDVAGSGSSAWVPTLVDYLYVSLTNSTAFSPTDTMPLTPRAKVLMGLQGVTALVISVLVISRGVNILK